MDPEINMAQEVQDASMIEDPSTISEDLVTEPQTTEAAPNEQENEPPQPTEEPAQSSETPAPKPKKPKYTPKDKTILSDTTTRKAKQQLTPLDRAFIAGAAWAGARPVDIAKHMKCGETTVRATLHKYKERGTFEDIPRPGRPKICDDDVEKRILLMLKEDPELTYNQLKAKAGITVSNATLRRVIKRHGLGAKIRIPHDPTAPMVPYPRWKVDGAKLKKIVDDQFVAIPTSPGGQAPQAQMQMQPSMDGPSEGQMPMPEMHPEQYVPEPMHHHGQHMDPHTMGHHDDHHMQDQHDNLDPELTGANVDGDHQGPQHDWQSIEERTDPALMDIAAQLRGYAEGGMRNAAQNAG